MEKQNLFKDKLNSISSALLACCLLLITTTGCSDTAILAQPSDPPAAVETTNTVANKSDIHGNNPAIATATAHSDMGNQESETPNSQEAGATGEADSGMLKTAGDLFEKAKTGTGATAKGAKDWMQDKLSGAAKSSGAAAEDTAKWATDTFNSLKDKGLTTASDTSEWLSQDWKNMQSWEYKVLAIPAGDNKSLEGMLNEYGAQGWDCIHFEGERMIFKKPADSYLRHLPFNDFIKLVPLLQQVN